MFLNKYKSLDVIYYSETKLIYKAFNIETDEYIVLKLFKKDSYYKEDFDKLEEILKLSNINDNNNLTSIYSIDTCIYNDTEYYIIECEYIEGETLDSLLESNVLNEEQGLEIVKYIISGLGELHNLNIIYRNLNCKNIYLDRKGFIKLDTTEYISTIKEKEETVYPSTDIYLLGTVFYKMMTKETIDLNNRPSYIDKERFSTLAVSILEKSIYQDMLHQYKSLKEFLVDIKSENNYILGTFEEDIKNEPKVKKNKYIKYVVGCIILGSMFIGSKFIENKNEVEEQQDTVVLSEDENLESDIEKEEIIEEEIVSNEVEEPDLNEEQVSSNNKVQNNTTSTNQSKPGTSSNSSTGKLPNRRPSSTGSSVTKPNSNNTNIGASNDSSLEDSSDSNNGPSDNIEEEPNIEPTIPDDTNQGQTTDQIPEEIPEVDSSDNNKNEEPENMIE